MPITSGTIEILLIANLDWGQLISCKSHILFPVANSLFSRVITERKGELSQPPSPERALFGWRGQKSCLEVLVHFGKSCTVVWTYTAISKCVAENPGMWMRPNSVSLPVLPNRRFRELSQKTLYIPSKLAVQVTKENQICIFLVFTKFTKVAN